MDRNEIERTVFAIDVSDDLGYLSLQFRRIREGGRRNLYKNDVANPLRVVLKEFFKRTKLIQNYPNES